MYKVFAFKLILGSPTIVHRFVMTYCCDWAGEKWTQEVGYRDATDLKKTFNATLKTCLLNQLIL